jgi:putative FmdB family regulatory protein
MPIYEYLCLKCGTKSEKLLKSSVPEIECKCGSRSIKVMSLPADPQVVGGTPKFHPKMGYARKDE